MNDETKAEVTTPLKARLIKISLVFIAVAFAAFAIAYAVWDIQTATVALVSAVVCGLAAVLAHVCTELPRGDMFIMVRLMSSSMVRVGLPLVMLVVVKLGFRDHFDRGMAYFVILFYVVGLLTDVKLQMKRFKPGNPHSKSLLSSPTGGDS